MSSIMDISHFEPSVHTEQSINQYRFKFTRSGLFQCSETSLVFVTTGEGEVLYRTVQWEERWFQPTGRTPAGPLFDIQCPQKSVCQLHLPHCDITPGDDLSVALITEEGLELLQPQRVTQTHVVVNVNHLSLFGILERVLSYLKPKRAQVLMFRQESRIRRTLSVLLLPSNVPYREVKDAHEGNQSIKVTSDCVLIPEQRYSLSVLQCPSQKVQPKAATYFGDNGPNYHPTFLVTMDVNAENFSMELLSPNSGPVWKQDITLEEKHFVDQHRRSMVERVRNVGPILDVLFEEDIIDEESYSDVLSKLTTQGQMRALYALLTSRTAKDTFHKALQESEKSLLEDLK